jgi:hypothetical protein
MPAWRSLRCLSVNAIFVKRVSNAQTENATIIPFYFSMNKNVCPSLSCLKLGKSARKFPRKTTKEVKPQAWVEAVDVHTTMVITTTYPICSQSIRHIMTSTRDAAILTSDIHRTACASVFILKYCHSPINFSWLIAHHPNIRRTKFCPKIVLDAAHFDFACFMSYSTQDPSLHKKKATVMIFFLCTVGELHNIHPSHFMILGERAALHDGGTTRRSSGMKEFA